jgi:hypothetical protein
VDSSTVSEDPDGGGNLPGGPRPLRDGVPTPPTLALAEAGGAALGASAAGSDGRVATTTVPLIPARLVVTATMPATVPAGDGVPGETQAAPSPLIPAGMVVTSIIPDVLLAEDGRRGKPRQSRPRNCRAAQWG